MIFSHEALQYSPTHSKIGAERSKPAFAGCTSLAVCASWRSPEACTYILAFLRMDVELSLLKCTPTEITFNAMVKFPKRHLSCRNLWELQCLRTKPFYCAT